jgi:hypothetical protein
MSKQSVEESQTPVSLQIDDLLKILEILNIVSQRGAIRPEEFSVVGGVYERIYQFLDASGVFKKTNQADKSEESTETVDESLSTKKSQSE